MVRYRISIDREACVGDRLCCDEAPETFELDEEGKVVVANPEGDLPHRILFAAQQCHFSALTLIDTETGQQVWPRG